MELISGAYDPKKTEPHIYEKWEKSGYFNPDNLPIRNSDLEIRNYIVYMPLPNVTGTLHMGHVLDNTLQDIVIRYRRMRGDRALWFPGTDHAGIATQYVVEKELKKKGVSRFELGREKFIEKVWEWKHEYGGAIIGQLKKLGVSADWSRSRFTMDPEYAKDVEKAFVHYHEKGLIYRGERVVNWCPRCGTSLSELELEYKEEEAKLYYITYGPFTLATTRPETKFGDTGLAVNPKDTRYTQYVGKELEIESLSTEGNLEKPKKKKNIIKVVADEAVDIEFGTGIVKVTPAHDMVDFEIGRRHNLPLVKVIDESGRMNAHAGKYAGIKTADARKKIVDDLKAVGLLQKEEDYRHNIAVCYRCGHIIEPIPSMQWFLKMSAKDESLSGQQTGACLGESLAQNAIEAVESGKVKIIPNNFEKKYFDWLKNIRDWTISRQIWWGHQIPVWFCKTQKERYVVSLDKPKTCPFCKNCEMEQSPDVLDTWFSSALWPFAGMKESDLKKYYPGTTLITARDILNLWVARMIFSGIEFMGDVPFSNVFIHGTILTKDGKRMSKSLGTGIDPLKYIDEYGADATRFGVIWQATGQDIRWDETAIVAGKKFANKLWNAARFVLQQTDNIQLTTDNIQKMTEADKIILEKLEETKKNVEKDIDEFEFSRPLHTIYEFFWHDFCDTYIELSKEQIKKEELKENTARILISVLTSSLTMLHPFIPFITEEIYTHIPLKEKKDCIMIEKW